MRTLAIVFAGVSFLAAGVTNVDAACIAARAVTSKNTTGVAYLYTPGSPFGTYGAATSSVRGSFWSLGYGNPANATPPNNDSGDNSGETRFPEGYGGASNWIEVGYYGYGTYLGDLYNGAHWQLPGTNGCIDWDGTNGDHVGSGLPDIGECNVALLDDDDGDGGGFFVVAAQTGINADYFMNLALTGGSGAVELSTIPVPQVVGVTSVAPGVIEAQVIIPCPTGPADGLYANCNADQNDALAGSVHYRVYSVTRPGPGSSAPGGPGSRDLPGGPNAPFAGNPDNPTGWVQVQGNATACGDTTSVTVLQDQNRATWLCSSYVFDPASGGGFETTNCSANSVRIEHTLAHPEDPVIRREKPTTERRRSGRERRPAGGR